MSRGDWTDPHLGKITVTDWASQVEASRLNRRPSTIARDDSYLRKLILPTFADHTLIQVQPVAVQQWVAKLNTTGYAAATIRKAYELLARIFTDSRRLGPHRPHTVSRRETAEDRTEREAVPHPRPRSSTSPTRSIPASRPLCSPLRTAAPDIGELAGLSVDHYEPLKRTIRIERNLTEVSGQPRLRRDQDPRSPTHRLDPNVARRRPRPTHRHLPRRRWLDLHRPCRRAAASHQLPHTLLETRRAILRR